MNIITFLCVILSVTATTNACSCVHQDETHPDFLCCYDYALRGTVVKDIFIGNRTFYNRTRVYTVKVEEIFKGEEKIKTFDGNTSYVEIHTAENDGPCGTNIPSNKDYFISGKSGQKQLENYLCNSYNEEWTNVKDSFKQFTPKLKTCPCSGVGLLPLQTLIVMAVFASVMNM